MNQNPKIPIMGGGKTMKHGWMLRAVWEGRLAKTTGGLTKGDLMVSKRGTIVSKKKHAAGKRLFTMMKKAGKLAKPFGKKTRKGRKARKGGAFW